MSDNYEGRRPEEGADPNQNQWQSGAGSANEAQQQWGQQDTQQFQAGSAPEAGQYGQDSYNPNSTAQVQSQNYGQGDGSYGSGQYGQSSFDPNSTQSYGAYNQSQSYGSGQYGQGQPNSYPPSQPTYGGGDGSSQYGGGYGQPPYGGDGGYGQPPQKGKGPFIAWIVLAVIVVVAVIVGILFATGVIGGGDDEADGGETTTATETVSEPDPDPTTDETEPPTTDPGPTTTDPEPDPTTTTSGTGGEGSYGSDAELDGYWDDCEAGDLAACDDLYWNSPIGSEYEEFGSTCGGTESQSWGSCDGANNSFSTNNTYGSDPELDALYDACEGGDMAACDDLYWDSPIGSEYEDLAYTCGGRTDYAAGTCELREQTGDF